LLEIPKGVIFIEREPALNIIQSILFWISEVSSISESTRSAANLAARLAERQENLMLSCLACVRQTKKLLTILIQLLKEPQNE
jgi:hypothetical protein